MVSATFISCPRHDHLMQVSLYNFNDNNAYSNYRGSDFRTDYADIQELRSIVNKKVGLMALTATVTPSTRLSIMSMLCMDKDDTFVIEKVPNRLNIKYNVQLKPTNRHYYQSGKPVTFKRNILC